MHRVRSLRSLVASLLLLTLMLNGTGAFAGTTGQVNGIVVETTTRKPVAEAKVVATSPSQSVSVSSDAQGRFSFLSLSPDTYTISVDKAGYAPTALTGVTVTADQTQNLVVNAATALQVIGRSQSRSASDLLKPGQGADVYSVNVAQAAAAAPLGGGGSLSQAYSAIASVPGVFIPSGQQGWAQSVYVRGGNYTQLGYEFDGVPVQRAYDAYPSSTLSALGQQEVQVYTGSQPGDAQSSGLAGFVNQVVKTGTFPSTGSLNFGEGSPTFYHKSEIEYGGASENRNFSYYIATAGYNQASRFVDPFDGATATYQYGSVAYATISHNCGTPSATAGCYTNAFGSAPNGYLYAPVIYGNNQFTSDRESVVNLHFGIPHKDGTKDDIQLLGDIASISQSFNDSYNSYNANKFFQTGVATYQGQTYQTCDDQFALNSNPCVNNLFGISGSAFNYNVRSIYTGPTGGALTSADLGKVSQYLYPLQSPVNAFKATVPTDNNGSEHINNSTYKVQYTHSMGSNAFARLYGYSLYSDWLNNDPNASSNPVANVSSDYILPTHTRGLGLSIDDQIGNSLLSLTGGYSTAKLSRWNNSFPSTANPVAVLVDSTNPTNGLCYTSAQAAAYCGGSSAARYTIPGTNLPASTGLVARSNGPVTVANAGTFTCGSGPCEFLSVGSGLNGSFNDVSPHFANMTVDDHWRASQKLTLDLAVRYDSFEYDIPSGATPGGPNPAGTSSTIGRAALNNSYNAFHCFTPDTGITTVTVANSCPAGTQVAFSTDNSGSIWYGGFQPRLSTTYQINSLNVLRAGYGRYLQPAITASTFYNRAGANIADYDAPKFYPYGFTTPQHNIPPQESWNLDFSWEHQVKGSDASWKISPFIRTTRNEDINVVLDPITGFIAAIPALSSNVKGVELLLRKGDFARNGFAGQLSYTYTFETSKYQTLPGGSTALDNVNVSIKQYNAYTSFCAKHAGSSQCGTPTNGAVAAPCYSAAGDADAACAAGSFANPYWNAPAQPLFDPNASYYPYNQTFGTGFGSNASSYNIPHVAVLILNYRHGPFAITPTVQLSAGGRYGSPVDELGIDPAGGCGTLASGVAGDPRYPYGGAGGAPYDAQSCPGFLVAPDPATKKFDSPGAFVEPSTLLANVGISYDISKRVTISLLGVNVFGTCFGGTKQSWTNAGPKIGCWYGAASGFQAGNFYNPGNSFQTQALPYLPVTGEIAGQTVYGTAINPFQLILSASIKL